MKILSVEADPSGADGVATMLGCRGYAVTSSPDITDATANLERENWDMVMPRISMREFPVSPIVALREYTDSPILALGKEDATRAINCLDSGADDYLALPCHVEELIARIKALGRRDRRAPLTIGEWGPLRIDYANCAVTANGMSCSLTRAEFLVLQLITKAGGKWVAAEKIGSVVGGCVERDEGNAAVYVYKINNKLKPYLGELKIIEGMQGKYSEGYRLRPLP